MLSETLATGLERYRIGPKVKALRRAKKLGLVQLGEHTGLSPALLSKIERGQLFPTLPTLLRIAMVFNVGLEHFFTETEERPSATIVRKEDRLRLPDRPGQERPSYVFESLDYPATDRAIEAFYAEFEPAGTASEPHSHEGPEFIYVTRGELVVTIEGEDFTLGTGDAMTFDPAQPHSYRGAKRSGAAALVIVGATKAASGPSRKPRRATS
jgi:quercetin dioxygenase-like cupin family protein/DNA-binding XRE family transcriptional regulator